MKQKLRNSWLKCENVTLDNKDNDVLNKLVDSLLVIITVMSVSLKHFSF